jgi:acetyl esterase/lipase
MRAGDFFFLLAPPWSIIMADNRNQGVHAMKNLGAISTFVFCVLGSATAIAQQPTEVPLWPGKPPGDVGIEGKEYFRDLIVKGKPHTVDGKPTKWLTNVSKPTLTIYRPATDKDTGTAILIAPGGGYHNLGWDVEGTEIAEWCNSLGITGIILKYRCPRRPGDPKGVPAPGPLKDAQRAVSLVRANAKEWGVNPNRIGMAGFSAGGHLVGSTCTNFEKRDYDAVDDIDKISCRPDFGIMCYSGYFKVDNGLTPTVKTPKGTPPLFFVHATDDAVSDVEHSVAFYLALKRAKIDTELHVYATGGHGFGVRPGSPCHSWTRTCADWMRSRGVLASK